MDEFNSCDLEDGISFESWLQDRCSESPTFKYWLILFNLEITLLSFVRAVRLGNYLEFRESMKDMMPWYFVFDHQNYSRWLSIHVWDLEHLECNAPDIHAEFMEGKHKIYFLAIYIYCSKIICVPLNS